MLEELAARGGLAGALGGRDAAGLKPLLRHLVRYIAEPRWAREGAGWRARLGAGAVRGRA